MISGYAVARIHNLPRYLVICESLLRDAEQFLTSNKRVKTTHLLYITLRFSREAHTHSFGEEIGDGDEEKKSEIKRAVLTSSGFKYDPRSF